MSSKTKKEDSSSATKAARLTKSRNSFRFGKNKSSVSNRSSADKTIAIQGFSNVEELEKKQNDVLRVLGYYEDAVEKKIPTYSVGVGTMILENVIHLSKDVDQMVPNTKSSEVSSLMARMNQSVADLVLWNDQLHLYGDDTHSVHPLYTIVNNVRQAVKALVEFAINKENQNLSNEFFHNASGNYHNESNGSSFCNQNSPRAKKKLNETRNSLIHGSMPEIFHPNVPLSNRDRSPALPPPPPLLLWSKLAHSASSDSILDNKDASISTKPPVDIINCDNLAPPIPPKKGWKHRHSSTNDLDCSPIRRENSPVNSSHGCYRRSAGSASPNSQVSPATSHDSMPHQNGCHLADSSTPIHGPSSAASNRSSTDCHSSLDSNYDENLCIPDLTTMLSQNVGINLLRSFNDSSSYSSPDSSSLSTPSNVSSSFNCSARAAKSYFSHHTVHISHSESVRTVVTTTSTSQVLLPSGGNNSQHLVNHRNSRSSTCSSSSRSSGSEGDSNSISMSVPPPIPIKKKQLLSSERTHSQYDNVVLSDSGISDIIDVRHTSTFLGKSELGRVRGMSTISCRTNSSSGLGSSESSMSSSCGDGESPMPPNLVVQRRQQQTLFAESKSCEKPPLPIKKKHVIEYMKTVSNHQIPESQWFSDRRSQQMITSHQMYSENYLTEEFRDLGLDYITTSSRLSLPASKFHLPPALPPKRKSKTSDYSCEKNQLEFASTDCNASASCSCQQRAKENLPIEYTTTPNSQPEGVTEAKENTNIPQELFSNDYVPPSADGNSSLLDSFNVNDDIVFRNTAEGSDVKEGSSDALLVYATYCKNGPFLEAFLTTYRTFFTPAEVIKKLFYRYHKFICIPKPEHQKAAKNSFSILVRIVRDLVVPELNEQLLKDLADFEYRLLAKGDLKLGLYFGKTLSDKLQLRIQHKEQYEYQVHCVILKDRNQPTFLDLKVHEVAEQMTYLDSELINKVGVPEILHFSRDQNEDPCPNLKLFCMQINNMSSWVKTLILKSSSQDRDKYYKKFVKIMKHLRKVNNNFNSCIAILSGLESAAVCRLDWPKAYTDILKEYRDLFGFEKSYRAYRLALADTKPPCIPHLAIILQDLTKLHIINPNNTNGKVNFLKRWLQFNILEDMKRFIPSKYELRRNESIINFINNFEDCMSEEDLWELSLTIKPQVHRNS